MCLLFYCIFFSDFFRIFVCAQQKRAIGIFIFVCILYLNAYLNIQYYGWIYFILIVQAVFDGCK